MRVIFMGTPDFAVPALQSILDAGHDVIAVYTRAPRPKGRGQTVQMTPVHMLADRHGIPVYTPKSLRRDPSAVAECVALNADVAVVAAYGLLLPPAVLDAPRYGCLNIHGSILPRWRGAAPIQYAVWKGDSETGVTVMQMEEGLDTGPMIAIRTVPITQTTTVTDLYESLARLGAATIVDVLAALPNGVTLTAQDDAKATLAGLLAKTDGVIDWTQDAAAIDRQIRALNPWPGTVTMISGISGISGQRLKILRATPAGQAAHDAIPGTVILQDNQPAVCCGAGTVLTLHTVQPENNKAMDATAALNGRMIQPGMCLGSA
ncbi:MAG: methionyl-tRNA formyltransferase [Pseudomonadota bacterium]